MEVATVVVPGGVVVDRLVDRLAGDVEVETDGYFGNFVFFFSNNLS